jgi:predicted Zn-dependent peptidase
VQDDRTATDIGAHLAFMEEAFDVRNPTAMIIEAHHGADVPADRVVTAVDEELDRIANDGVPEDELARIRARTASSMLQRADHVLARTLAMASYEQQRGRAELVAEMPALLAAVTTEQVSAAAASLRPECRARIDVIADGAR